MLQPNFLGEEPKRSTGCGTRHLSVTWNWGGLPFHRRGCCSIKGYYDLNDLQRSLAYTVPGPPDDAEPDMNQQSMISQQELAVASEFWPFW
jgi:hypothetical protein